MFSKVEGKLWVDKQDHGWIKVDGQVIQPISIGLFLARVLRGSHITMQQMRVDNGIWMPERVEVRAVPGGGRSVFPAGDLGRDKLLKQIA